MPELPEAEVVRRYLHAAVVGTTINHIRVGREDIVRQGVESLSWYSGSRITEVQRHGKSVVLICERGAEKRVVVAELGMTGLLLFTREAIPSAKHVHVMMSLANGQQPELWYWNARRFGRLYLLDQKDWKAYRQRRFGHDPFTMTGDEFVDLIKSCRGRIKAVLLNQHRIAGIGNIYANEALFRAGIHPYARGCRLSKKESVRCLKPCNACWRKRLPWAVRRFAASSRRMAHRDNTRAGTWCIKRQTNFVRPGVETGFELSWMNARRLYVQPARKGKRTSYTPRDLGLRVTLLCLIFFLSACGPFARIRTRNLCLPWTKTFS